MGRLIGIGAAVNHADGARSVLHSDQVCEASALAGFLQEARLADAGELGHWTPLTGGVASDIWRVDLRRGTICVKRALARLRVAAAWEAPVSRTLAEQAYLEVAGRLVPGSVPAILARDAAAGAFAMEWMDPARYRLWKAELLAGRVVAADAGAVGRTLGAIHARSVRDPGLPARFAINAFHQLRIEPYLLFTTGKHPALAARLIALAERTAAIRLALVHGDVSPKNIFIGQDQPVLLDAECACFGDPAFDVAFCLTHLVVKARVVSGAGAPAAAATEQFIATYLAEVDWEERSALEHRAATLLPALALARVDGKSPLEYLTAVQQGALRAVAAATLHASPTRLADAVGMLAA